YTDHQCPDDQCDLLFRVGGRHLSVPISAICQCSMPHTSGHQCHISVATSAHQCHISVPIRAASQRSLLVPVSDAYQCPSVPPISVLCVLPFSTHQ
ncbi:unnamed protein product, partial [Staurois parvus]